MNALAYQVQVQAKGLLITNILLSASKTVSTVETVAFATDFLSWMSLFASLPKVELCTLFTAYECQPQGVSGFMCCDGQKGVNSTLGSVLYPSSYGQ
jgi:hypothetical protein